LYFTRFEKRIKREPVIRKMALWRRILISFQRFFYNLRLKLLRQ
jgi:hypothetical protein